MAQKTLTPKGKKHTLMLNKKGALKMKKFFLLCFCLLMTSTSSYAEPLIKDTREICGDTEYIADMDNWSAALKFRDWIYKNYQVNVSVPFKQNKLNYFVLGAARIIDGRIIFVSRDKVFDIVCNGHYEIDYDPLEGENCTTLVDEEDETLLRCEHVFEGTTFYRFYLFKEEHLFTFSEDFSQSPDPKQKLKFSKNWASIIAVPTDINKDKSKD